MGKINELSKTNSILSTFISELRDVKIQKDRMRYRRNLERLGEVFAYEISKTLEYENTKVTTPLGVADVSLLKDQPIIATIFRAGIPFHQGFLNYFENADSAFVSARRIEQEQQKGLDFEIQVGYVSTPSLENKTLFVVDPMLATGLSLVAVYKALAEYGKPKHTHVAAIVASKQGVEHAKKSLPENTTLWLGVIDEKLNDHGYIVPGLGDAGDLAYGERI